MISVSLDTGEPDRGFAFRDREVVLEWPYYTGAEGRNYDLSPDGQRFLAVKVGSGADENAMQRTYIVTDWFEELRQRMGNN